VSSTRGDAPGEGKREEGRQAMKWLRCARAERKRASAGLQRVVKSSGGCGGAAIAGLWVRDGSRV
jgi:hypothetical protein